MSSIFYIDGEFVREEDATIAASDLSVLRGYGVFDYMRTYNGHPFYLDAHLDRLNNSARLIGLKLPHPQEEIRQIIMDTIARNNHEEYNVRIVVTGGSSPDNIIPVGESRLLVYITPFKPMPQEWYTEGIKVVTEHSERAIPQAKTINYIPAIIALNRASQVNALDAIYITPEGHVLEGTTTNIFAFFGDTLVTAGEGILHGITRKVVLELAAQQFTVETRALTLDELLKADEVFLTSSNKEVCPIRQVDETVYPAPGPNTQRLMATFSEYAANYKG